MHTGLVLRSVMATHDLSSMVVSITVLTRVFVKLYPKGGPVD
jgi:hypothetical protein